MHIQVSLFLHFCLLFLLLNNCDVNDAKHNAFSLVDCWLVAVKRAGFILAYVQNDVLSPSRMHTTAFFIDPTASLLRTFGDIPCVNEALQLLQVAGVASFPSQIFKSKQSK